MAKIKINGMVAKMVLVINAVVAKYWGNRTPPSIAPYISMAKMKSVITTSNTNGILLIVDFRSIFKNERMVDRKYKLPLVWVDAGLNV